jgi:hypothetical protein
MSGLMKLLRILAACIETPADPDTTYLGGAKDICDLERRMRVLEART